MEQKLKNNLIYISLFVFLVMLAFAFVMVFMIKENNQCLEDPFKYSAIKLNESGGQYTCKCTALTPDLLDFSFDTEGIKIINPNDFYNFNIGQKEEFKK